MGLREDNPQEDVGEDQRRLDSGLIRVTLAF